MFILSLFLELQMTKKNLPTLIFLRTQMILLPGDLSIQIFHLTGNIQRFVTFYPVNPDLLDMDQPVK